VLGGGSISGLVSTSQQYSQKPSQFESTFSNLFENEDIKRDVIAHNETICIQIFVSSGDNGKEPKSIVVTQAKETKKKSPRIYIHKQPKKQGKCHFHPGLLSSQDEHKSRHPHIFCLTFHIQSLLSLHFGTQLESQNLLKFSHFLSILK
jgi:hypothetical protein